MGKGVHISDDAYQWIDQTVFIPWTSFMSIGNIALDGESALIWITEGSGTTAGTPLVGEIGATSTDIAGISMAAAGDLISTYWILPSNMNMTDPGVNCRVHFVHIATGADTPIWKVHHLDLAKQQAVLEPVGDATEVVTFGAHTCSTTADSLEVTAWKALATQPASTDVGWLLALELDAVGSASADEIFILGLEFGYSTNLLSSQGPGA